MNAFTHTRCYNCGTVILIEEAVRRNVRVGSSSFYGSTGGHYDNLGYSHRGFVSGSGRQWQRVDYCPSCDKKARESEKLALILLLVMALVAAVFLLLCVAGVVYQQTNHNWFDEQRFPTNRPPSREEPEAKAKVEVDPLEKAKVEAERAKAKVEVDPLEKAKVEAERAKAKAKADAEAKAEAERCEVEMVRYELAKCRFHAAVKLRNARILALDAENESAKGNERESERLLGRAKVRFQEVIDQYPDTAEASDSKQLLDGNIVPFRPLPPAPVLPKGVTASEEELMGKPKPAAGPSKFVYVRGYTRKDGVFVAPHFGIVPP